MTLSDDAARIAAMADEVVAAGNAPIGKLYGELTVSLQTVRAAMSVVEDPVGEVGDILGDGHMGVDAIAGATAAVIEPLERIQLGLNQLVRELETTRGALDTLGFVYNNIASDIRRAGGAI